MTLTLALTDPVTQPAAARQIATCPVCDAPVPNLTSECSRTRACRDESAGDDLTYRFRAGLK